MAITTTFNYSPNFKDKKRSKKRIKFLIFHYTGMKSEIKAIRRLTDFQSQVASHYLIKASGDIRESLACLQMLSNQLNLPYKKNV